MSISMDNYTGLRKKISAKKAKITVMGLGYVGLPMAIEFAGKGFSVTGFDPNTKRVTRLKKGLSYISDIPEKDIRDIIKKGRLCVTSDEKVLGKTDVMVICVPTPLRKTKDPNISYVVSAARTIARHMRPGQLIILESTTYPGTTREVVLPIFLRSGLAAEKDFFLAFSPERIDPGNPKYGLTTIPKVVGGFTKRGTELSRLLYSKIIKKVVGVTTPEAAEMTKLLENTFRIVNIGLINEFATLCHKLKIDVWE